MLLDERIHVIPALEPADITTTTTYTDIVGVKEYQAIEFVIVLGAITGDTIALTVEECDTIVPANSTAIAFSYRKSSAAGTDSMGATTAATSSGITVAATDDNKIILIDVDPAALTDGYPYIRVAMDPGASMSECVVGAVCLLTSRYAQATQISAVD